MKQPDRTYEQFKSHCDKCCGLCCVSLFFSKIDGFPYDKRADIPCRHLCEKFSCEIHQELSKRQLKGCIGYDCFGAGVFVTQHLYHGRNWHDKAIQSEMFALFHVVFQLFQIKYYLLEAMAIKEYEEEVMILFQENETLCNQKPFEILKINVDRYREHVNQTLKKICKKISKQPSKISYIGKNLQGKNFSDVDFSMQILIGTNFKGCKLHRTVFLGADTRDADFSDADLHNAMFLSQGQLNTAKGNHVTKLPAHLSYPTHWK